MIVSLIVNIGRLKLIQTNKCVVSNKDRVVGKIVFEKLSMWKRLLETLESISHVVFDRKL